MRYLILLFLFTFSVLADSKRSSQLNELGVKHAQKGELDQAADFFKQAIKNDKNNLTAVYNLANIYISNKNEKQAISLLEGYTRNKPKDAGLFAILADAYFSDQNVKKAIKNYTKSLKLDAKYPGSAKKLATAYALSNDNKSAEKYLLKALNLEPDSYVLLNNLASIQLSLGKTKESIAAAKKGLQSKATSDLYITLATAYEIEKNYKDALIAFNRAVDLGNESNELQEKIKELESLAEKQ